jgi:hypothetical protein
MGHRDPWRAQLAIWSRVVRAYCMAPDLTSCEGRGTSRRRPPVTGRREASLIVEGMVGTVAEVGADDDIMAEGVARRRSGVLVCAAGKGESV